jgi:hypothetical protein
MNDGSEKFNNCKYRSEEQVEVGEFSCCSNTLHMAYICFARNIEDLMIEHCKDCIKFKEKQKNGSEN